MSNDEGDNVKRSGSLKIRHHKFREETKNKIMKENKVIVSRLQEIVLKKPRIIQECKSVDKYLQQKNHADKKLAKERKKHKLEEITQQNKSIYIRIENAKTSYSLKELNQERERQLALLKRMRKFPLKELEKKTVEENTNGAKNISDSPRKLLDKVYETDLPIRRIVVYEGESYEGERDLKMKIYKTSKDFQVEIFNIRSQDTIIIHVIDDKFLSFLKHIDYDYKKIFALLTINEGRAEIDMKNPNKLHMHRRLVVPKQRHIKYVRKEENS